MGYVRQKKVFKLKFVDEEMAGLEVKAKSLPLGDFLEVIRLLADDINVLAKEDQERIDRLFQIFLDAVVSWNLEEEDGDEIPLVLESLYEQDTGFVLVIIRAWVEAIKDVSPPLPESSKNGGQSQEESLPMETLSEDLAS